MSSPPFFVLCSCVCRIFFEEGFPGCCRLPDFQTIQFRGRQCERKNKTKNTMLPCWTWNSLALVLVLALALLLLRAKLPPISSFSFCRAQLDFNFLWAMNGFAVLLFGVKCLIKLNGESYANFIPSLLGAPGNWLLWCWCLVKGEKLNNNSPIIFLISAVTKVRLLFLLNAGQDISEDMEEENAGRRKKTQPSC